MENNTRVGDYTRNTTNSILLSQTIMDMVGPPSLASSSSLSSSANSTDDEFSSIIIPTLMEVEIVLMAAILTVALIGNLCLCCVVLSDDKLRSVPNKLVLNLAFCGLFTVIANGPFILATFATGNGWIFNDMWCQFNGFTTSTYGLSSVLTLAVISVNRYQMIRRTTRRTPMWFTDDRIPYLIAGVWFFSAFLSLPPIIGWSSYSFIEVRAICTLQWSTDPSYTAFMFTLGILTPFTIIFVTYFRIFTLVRKNFERMRVHARQSSFRRQNEESKKRGKRDNKRGQDEKSAVAEGLSRLKPSISADFIIRPRAVTPATDASVSQYLRHSAMDNKTEMPNQFIAPPVNTENASKHNLDISNKITSEICCYDVSSYTSDLQLPDFANNEQSLESYTIDCKNMANRAKEVDDDPAPGENCQVSDEQDSRCSSCKSSSIEEQELSSDKTPQGMYNANCQLQYHPNVPDNNQVQQHKHTRNTAGGIFQTRLTTSAFRRSNVFLPRDDLRLTIMVFVVLASFILCWAPITIINFVESVLCLQVSRLLNIIAVFMMFLSAAINPIIYGLMNRNSRRIFYRMFFGWTRKFCRRKPNTNKVSTVLGSNEENTR